MEAVYYSETILNILVPIPNPTAPYHTNRLLHKSRLLDNILSEYQKSELLRNRYYRFNVALGKCMPIILCLSESNGFPQASIKCHENMFHAWR